MSYINKLPGGGKKFKVDNFDVKFKKLSTRDSKIAAISDNQKSIINAIKNYQYAIRSGSFSKSQQENALSQMKRGSKFNSDQVNTMKKIINHLAAGSENNEKDSKIRIIKADNEEIVMTGLASHNDRPRGPGLSSLSAPPEDYSSAVQKPVTSVKDLMNKNKVQSESSSTGSSGQRPPMIPLSR
ncbi:MAG: hypothetical protein EOM88_01740 [Clostridia bacterium]|nr:hypothetical protein [Clostridia bacterium]